jgi:hypothetical protein
MDLCDYIEWYVNGSPVEPTCGTDGRIWRRTEVRASSALIAPAGLIGAAIGVLDHGGDPYRWRHHSSRSLSFASASLNFILKTLNPCWAVRSQTHGWRWRGYCERSEVHPLYSAILSRVTSFDGKSSTVEAGFCR